MNTQIITKGQLIDTVETENATLSIYRTAQNLMASEMDVLLDNIPLTYTVMEMAVSGLMSQVSELSYTEDGDLPTVTNGEYVGTVAAIQSLFDVTLSELDDKYLYYVKVEGK